VGERTEAVHLRLEDPVGVIERFRDAEQAHRRVASPNRRFRILSGAALTPPGEEAEGWSLADECREGRRLLGSAVYGVVEIRVLH
jgi:hypothetical protein